VQKHAMRSWKDDLNFREEVMKDKEITSRVPEKQIEHAFSIQRQLRNVDRIFERVFESKPASIQTEKQKKTSVAATDDDEERFEPREI
jgi:hypothetical protein